LPIKNGDFFVVTCSKRVNVIENEVKSRMNVSPNPGLPEAFSLEPIEVGVIPSQDMDLQLRFSIQEVSQVMPKRRELRCELNA